MLGAHAMPEPALLTEPRNEPVLRAGALSICWRFLRLGCRCFGGPVAHIAYFRETLVHGERYVAEPVFAQLLALCQFLPGPTSSQLGLLIGYQRGRLPGALAAWLGFTAPSFILMVIAACTAVSVLGATTLALLHGLKLAVVAIVADAVRGMAKTLCPSGRHAVIAGTAAAASLVLTGAWSQIAVLIGAGILGMLLLRGSPASSAAIPVVPSRALTIACWLALLGGLGLSLAAVPGEHSSWVRLPALCYRAGAFVFGGGHVVLPLLQPDAVGSGMVPNDTFFYGYSVAQLMPGPLFTIASFLGASVGAAHGVLGAIGLAALATVAIFAPGALAALGALRGFARLHQHPSTVALVAGVNSGTVGLLAAACYHPIATSAIASQADAAIAILSFSLLTVPLPSWLIVLGCAAIGAALH